MDRTHRVIWSLTPAVIYSVRLSKVGSGAGTVFEVGKTSGGYAVTPTTLVSFVGGDGTFPSGGLIADAAGDLFGTTQEGGATNEGTVFEIAKTSTGYASTPTTLVSFNGTDGSEPEAGLFADAAGDLLGTTTYGGANSDGTLFEILKTGSGYASTPTTLVSFNGADGQHPIAGLIADASGDLSGQRQMAGRRPMARCSKSPRRAPGTRARRPYLPHSIRQRCCTRGRSYHGRFGRPLRHDI